MNGRWVTFDCYGTLINWNRGIGDALQTLFPAAGRAALLEHYHTIEPVLESSDPTSYRDVLARAVLEIAVRLGVSLSPGAEEALAASLPEWPPFEEVPSALSEIRDAGWRIAILSNTDPDFLTASMNRIGVEPDLKVTFADTGTYKPAPGHWETFFHASGAEKDRHVHVGASLFHDIEPCAWLGLAAVWINRLDERSEVPRAAELLDLSDLPATLEQIVPV